MSTEKPIPIGKLIQHSIPAIFEYCETQDPTEFARLQDQQYSKETFNINYPFCQPVTKVGPDQNPRFWAKRYLVHGVTVRVTNDWYNPPTSNSLPLFLKYLERRGLSAQIKSHSEPEDFSGHQVSLPQRMRKNLAPTQSTAMPSEMRKISLSAISCLASPTTTSALKTGKTLLRALAVAAPIAAQKAPH